MKVLVNPVVFGYWVVSAVAAVGYFSLVLRGVVWVGQRDGGALIGVALIVGLVFGLVSWPFVLGVVWWGRRAYLRRNGEAVVATVVGAGRRVTRSSNNPLSTHRVRLEVRFTHPATGAEYGMKKEFAFNELRKSTASALMDRFPVGAELPMLVRGRAAGFDVAPRPQWVDIW
ncbi:hypothetical protein ACFC06_17335 [Nocardia sp. NPDC056064]|uniref:hypothetical protein n=1 Tax=Nocardia sp. NPDC056064 TaxID=3345701 RepID=UPI0035D7F786